MNGNPWLSLPQAARVAGVKRQEMLRAIRTFELPAKLVEHRWWIRATALELWRERRRRPPTPKGGET